LLNQIWIGIDVILLNFLATFVSVLGLQFIVLIRVSQIRGECLLCLFKMSLTSETSLLYCASCQQVKELVGHSLIESLSWLISVVPNVHLVALSTVNHYLHAQPSSNELFVLYICLSSGLIHFMLLLSLTELLVALLHTVNILKSLQSQLLWCC